MTINTVAIALALLAAAPAAPAASEGEVWALARKANSAPAYEGYLLRFSQGKHSGKAIKAFYRVQNLPIPKGPWYHPSPYPSGVIVAPTAGSDTCRPPFFGEVREAAELEQGRDYLAARVANRPAGFQAYIAKYPDGACTRDLAYKLRIRREQIDRFRPIAGFGPLAPHPLMPFSILFTVDDYPARALRNRESGTVVAGFEVAEDGFVEGCHIVQSSGSAVLDQTTCRLFVGRMRYDPARNRAGVPVRSSLSHAFEWVLPPR
ncbi:MAG TPA: energy transducer TonB [Allosphingosinicella sp.]|nr:energy transducer TonB [Allosphingosinicella sp.]